MEKYKPSEFLKQAIEKTQEAYEALKILKEHDEYAGVYDCEYSIEHVEKALKGLRKTIEERQEAVHNAQIRKIQEKRLCEKLGIPYPYPERG